MSKGFWGVVVVIVLIFVGIFAFSGDKTSAPSKNSGKPTEHITGQGKSGVTLVEYGDYQCPFCAQAHPVIKQVVADMDEQIRFQFRNFPIVSSHQNAFSAARAAEAAGLQNKFWEMHDALYENQNQWSSLNNPVPYFDKLARQINLNANQFSSDYKSSKVNDLINADVAAGTKLKVDSTPVFFLNGKRVDIRYANGPDAVKKTIQAEIDKQKPQQ